MDTFTQDHAEIVYQLREDGGVEIEVLAVEEGYLGKGHGKGILQDFIAYARAKYQPIAFTLTACPDQDQGGLCLSDLIRFYSFFGFTIFDYVTIADDYHNEYPRMVLI